MANINPIPRAKGNIRSECGGKFLDLNAGGGQNPAVINWDNGTADTNPNEIWEIWGLVASDPKDSRVLIQSTANKGLVGVDPSNPTNPVTCVIEPSVADETYQWYLEGANATHLTPGDVIRFRSVKFPANYLDLYQLNTDNGTPFITWTNTDGSNQKFRFFPK